MSQQTLQADNSELQVARNDPYERGVYCPDCGADVARSKGGGKPMPDDAPVDACFGWYCGECKNTMPSNALREDAPGFNDQMTAVRADFRDGVERLIPTSKSAIEEVESR